MTGMTRRTVLLAAAQTGSSPLDLGTRRELFADPWLLASLEGCELRLAEPRDAGTALAFDRPWEGRFSAYATVLLDRGRYRLYYRGVPNAGQDGRGDEVTCHAESADGRTFTRPDNNIILSKTPPFQHNFSPFLDTRPGVPSEERFKALAGIQKSGLAAFASADGLRWRKLQEDAVFKEGAFDSQNLAFWSEHEKTYVCYYRTFKRIGKTGYRWISRAVSQDFLRWENQGEMSFGDAPPEHLYTNQTSPYFRAPHLYTAICARFFPGRQVLTPEEARQVGVDPGYFKDCSDAVLLTSRGGTTYDRTFLEAFLRPGLGLENWVSRSNYPALNVVPTGDREMSFYVVRRYGQPDIHLRRYALRTDGFASLHASGRGGVALSKPLRFAGRRLELNFSTSAAGFVKVAVETPQGAELASTGELIGDHIALTPPVDFGSQAGREVRLKFSLKDADLYSLKFS